MATFTPQRVPAHSIWLWLREGFALCQRQPIYFLCITAGWAGVSYLPLPFTYLLLLGLPVPLAAGCLVAHAADTSRSPLEVLLAMRFGVWRDLLIAGAAPWIAVVGMIGAITVLTLPFTVALNGNADFLAGLPLGTPHDWQAFRDLFGVTFLWLCTVGFVGWFVVPLMAIAGLPLVQAYNQTVRGIALNGFVVGVVFFAAWVCVPLLSFLSPLFVAPVLSILSSVMYVSFRHIWLGKGKNEAVRVAEEIGSVRFSATPVLNNK